MKQFFKIMFASFFGTLLTILVITIIFVGIIAGIVASAEGDEVTIKPHTILHINWKTEIKDRSNDNPFENFDFASMESNKPIGLNDILKNIEKAASDPNIDGIFLDMESVPAGMATEEEIRNKLLKFKESGKWIVSYGNSYDQKAYYLASVADNIYMNPEGMILFKGLHAQVAFLKEMFNKLEIDMQIVRGPNNKYKSAVEPLMLDKMSEANREQLQALLNSVWGKMLSALSESRGISIDDLNRIADNLDLSMADDALSNNFVDAIIYRDELINKLKELTEVEDKDDLETVSFSAYTSVKAQESKKLQKDQIAVIYAEGDIVQGKGGDGSIGSASMARTIREVRRNDKIKAIVFRVNSPGGDALASEEIRREVELAKNEKPFIVSMGNLAASGGYWISTNADYIFAQPTTITGSIGVFGVIPNFQALFSNKLGINFDDVMTNKNSDFIDVMKPMSEFQHEKIDQVIAKIYQDFTELVAKTRALELSYVDSIARGRVWSGIDALELGLVDEMGGMEDAIAFAAVEAELGENYRITEYPKQKDFFEQIVEELTGKTTARVFGNELGEFKTYYDQIQYVSKMNGVQARLPFIFTIE
ncbi:MAG TPA: signal peptide peptidase SppA [Bacteroidales bacterium]